MRIDYQRVHQHPVLRSSFWARSRTRWSLLMALCSCNCLFAQSNSPPLNAAQQSVSHLFVPTEPAKTSRTAKAVQSAPPLAALFVQPESSKAAPTPSRGTKPAPANARPSAPPPAPASLFVQPGPPKAAAAAPSPTNAAQAAPPFVAILAPPKPAQADILPPGDWKIFKSKFVSGDGRVIDTANENVSHSEGQGYGMLLAVAYGDRPTFDKMWKWTQKNLQVRNDHLFSWRWHPNPAPGQPSVNDPNNASDGDVLIAWALLRAFLTWGDPGYQQASAAILHDLRKCLADTRFGPSLLPAEVGFVRSHETVLNPSYSIFQAYREFGRSQSKGNWSGLEASGLSLVGNARVGQWLLAPEWVGVSSQGLSMPQEFPPEFGYNAVRVPLYLAWRHPRSQHLQPFYNFWHSFPGGYMPAGVNLATNAPLKHPALPGVKAISQWITACVEKKQISVSDIPPLSSSESYYSACLKLLTKVGIQETNTFKTQ